MAGAAFIKLTLDDAALQKGLEQAHGKLKAFKQAEAVVNQMAVAFTALNVPIIGAMKSFAAFDDQVRMVRAVTGATAGAMAELTEQAKQLGRETSFTASEVASGMLALGRMGLTPEEIKNTIRPMMDLSRVTGTELGQAAEIAANNMRVFGLQAADMSEIADLLSVTANSSAQTLTDLGEALKMAGPHAKRAGADLKDTAAAIGILANMGIKGSLAGTALGKSYKKLADPKTIDYLKQYGVETLNADGSLRRMRDTLVDIAKAMQKMTNAQQIAFMEKVFDARGSLGGGTLAVNTAAIDEFVKKLDKASGDTAKKAEEMEAGIGGALRKLGSAAEGVSLAFGELISVSFLPLVEKLSDVCGWLRKIVSENGNVIGSITKALYLVLGAGAALKVVTMFYHGIVNILLPLGKLIKMLFTVKALAIMTNPIVITLAAVAAVLTTIAVHTSNAAKKMREYAEAQKEAADKATALRIAGDKQRQEDRARFERLKDLEEVSKKAKLTAAEMKEAEQIINDLEPYGSKYWSMLDKIQGKLILTADAQRSLNREMKKAAETQIRNEIAALEAEKKALEYENEALMGYWHHTGLAMITGQQDMALAQIKANGERASAIYGKILEAKNRLKGIVGGDLDAITGGKGTAGGGAAGGLVPDTDDAEEATKAETKALDKLKDMEEDLAKQRRTNLENEIAAIQKLRDEYTKNIDLLIQQKKIAFEAAKEGGEVERAIELSTDIARYNRQKSAAMAGYDQMEADARKKDAARREKERRDYERFMDDMSKDAQERALGRELDTMNREKDYSGLQAYLNILIDSQSKALNAAVTQYNDQLTAFLDKNSEGGEEIVEAEKDVLRDIQDAINEANGRIIDYTERLERAQQAADDAAKMPEAHVVGAWSLAALEQLFDASAMDRTAHATEKMVSQQDKQLANQDKMNRTLTQIKDESQLVYGD
jgi:TP901 family phage tail tape measure protein